MICDFFPTFEVAFLLLNTSGLHWILLPNASARVVTGLAMKTGSRSAKSSRNAGPSQEKEYIVDNKTDQTKNVN